MTRKKVITAKPYDQCIFCNDYPLRQNQSLTINNITSKLDLREFSSPKSPQIQCRHAYRKLCMPCCCYFAKGLHQNWQKVSCKQAFRRKLLTATAENHPKSKATFAVFNSSFNVVGGMVSSFVINVNAWEQTRTFLLRYKKQYCPCFQICYGNSVQARLITCSCSNFFFTSRSLSSWVSSYSLIFSVAKKP